MSEESRRQARRERREAERRAAAEQAANQPAQSVVIAEAPTENSAENGVGTSPVAEQAGGTVENIGSSPAENAGGSGGAPERVQEIRPERLPEVLPPSIDMNSVKDQRLVARALAELWEIDSQYRAPLVKGQIAIALDSRKDARDRTRAFLAVTKASQQNLAIVKTIAEIEKPAAGTNVNVGVAVSVGAPTRQELLNEPAYLEFLRTAAADSDTGSVCPNGIEQSSEAVEAGETPANAG